MESNQEEQEEKIMSVTQYAKEVNKSRQAILRKIERKKLPSNVTANKVGSTWIITINPLTT